MAGWPDSTGGLYHDDHRGTCGCTWLTFSMFFFMQLQLSHFVSYLLKAVVVRSSSEIRDHILSLLPLCRLFMRLYLFPLYTLESLSSLRARVYCERLVLVRVSRISSHAEEAHEFFERNKFLVQQLQG